ncbi:hypothetical protein LTS18_011500, partial [Coniosporium uncinatum]
MSSARRGGRGRGGVNIANASTSDAPPGPRNGARGRGNINRANTRATSRSITRGPRGGGGGGGRDTQTQSRGGRATPPPPNSARENRFGGANNATPILQDGSLSSRFAMLQQRRRQERDVAIESGFLADPNKPRTLDEAITLVGTCQDMCPEFERVDRMRTNPVDIFQPEA